MVENRSYIGTLTGIDIRGYDLVNEELGQGAASVSREISPNDGMYSSSRGGYFLAGADALRCIRDTMDQAGVATVRAALDWACGHGRVLRMLKAAFPNARLAAADINQDGVDFCARTFRAKPIYSNSDADQVSVDDKFDLIWAGSFFTHLSADRWSPFLSMFENLLAPGGLLVFSSLSRLDAPTLKGLRMNEAQTDAMIRAYDREGFGYSESDVSRSGLTISSPMWVRRQIEQRPGLDLIRYKESEWRPPSPRQDIVGCLKVSSWT